MSKCIVEIDGKQIVWFDNFLKSKTDKIGLRFSGGVESTLLLWMLCYFCNISERYDIEIYPFFMRDWYKKIPSKGQRLKKIVNIIQNQFPNIKLKNLDLTMFWSYNPDDPFNKEVKLEPTCERKENYLKEKYGIKWFINGINLNHTEEEFLKFGVSKEEYETRDVRRDAHRILTNTDTFEYDVIRCIPFYNITKMEVKKLYERYNLLESLFPLTDSCLSDILPFPCKKCLWCKERYAIFGSYDFGLQ